MQVEVALALRLDALRREDQRLVAVELREVRALPHEALIAVCLGHDVLELPVLEVLRREDEHLAHLVCRLCADDRVVAALVLPDLRIAEVMILARRDVLRQLDDRILLRLLEVDAVDADREILRLDAVRLARLLQQVDMACIEQVELAVLLDATAREAAICIVRMIREERDRLTLPVHEILARRMRPVHRPPLRLVRVVLIEEMVLAAKVGKAIRVIAPADARRDVEARIPALVDLRLMCRNKRVRREFFLFVCHRLHLV